MSANQNITGNNQTNGAIGKPIDRVDGRLKVTGQARFAAEWPQDNMTHAVLIGSTIASGRIRSIDTKDALKSPGVLAVLTYQNMPKLKPVVTNPREEPNARRLPLQTPDIYYSNQYVAVVVAETIEKARQGARLVRITYEQQTPATVLDSERGKAFSPKVVFDKPPDTNRGDVPAGLSAAEVKLDETYRTPTEHHNPMEPHATTVVSDGDKLTVYDSTQYTYGVRHSIATNFGIPEENVHVICKFTGGAFGCKGTPWQHIAVAVAAARQVKRPLKLYVTRQQMFANVGHRAETEQHVVLAAKRTGELTAIVHEGFSHTATYDEYVEPFTKPTHMMYGTPNLKTSQKLIPLNVGVPTYMRAPGECSGMFALESALDELAYKLKMDPLRLRLVNYAETDPDTKLPWSTKLLKDCYKQAADKFGWSRRKPEPRSMREGRYLIGMGMATAVYPVNHFPSSARVRILRDGTAIAESSTHDLGTGTYTVLTQIACETLGLPVEKVQVIIGDTNLPKAMVSGGSSTVMSVGTSIQGASKAAIAKLVEIASADSQSPLHGATVDRVVAKDGKLSLKDNPGKGEVFSAILSRAGIKEVEGNFDTQFNDKEKTHSAHSFGAHFAEVRVDPDLGEVRVTRFVGAYDVGKAMNMKTATSQMQGGVIMGIGMALMEATILDPNIGRFVNQDLAEYHVPIIADVPVIDATVLQSFDPYASAIEAKGAGELGIVSAAAAVANAVYHATGVRIRDLPITPDKLL